MAAVKIMILWDGKEAWPTNSSHHPLVLPVKQEVQKKEELCLHSGVM